MNEYEYLCGLIKEEYPLLAEKIIKGFSGKRATTLRVNTIKATNEMVEEELNKLDIKFSCVEGINNAYIVESDEATLLESSLCTKGYVYLQSLSSMIPPIILGPKENKDILDMAAAPGGKTTELAALTENKARITACEMNKIRCERLKYNVDLQGASSVYVMNTDSRRLDEFFMFDQILLDAPCSGSGTSTLEDASPFKGFTRVLVEKSVKSQKALINTAFNHLKVGGELVYSTCSILSEENDDVVLSLPKGKYELIPVDIKAMELYKIPTKLEETLTVMPNKYYEGFYIAKIRKIK